LSEPIRVMILEDHQAIIDGYLYRLNPAPDIQVCGALMRGDELEQALEQQSVDVLLADVQVPVSEENPNPYPILHVIPKLLEKYPDMAVIVISMHSQRALVRALREAGASGYILKDDRAAMLDLPAIIRLVHAGGIYFSQAVARLLMAQPGEGEGLLTARQAEVLSYCAAYPEISTAQIAHQLHIAQSTVRNLLSGAYLRLEVPNRAAAIARARQLGLIAPDAPPSVT
jgi:two-component system, NarL family, nitrate/nitrite response regulator NarL